MDLSHFERRKQEHLHEALRPENQVSEGHVFDEIHLFHDALPELDLKRIKLATKSLGLDALTPFYISGMTAGHAQAKSINDMFAQACVVRGWALGLGSNRRDLFGDSLEDWAEFRKRFPTLEIFANIGVSQLKGMDYERLHAFLEKLKPSAFFLHANSLQEALQPEGTPDFSGVLDQIEIFSKFCREYRTEMAVGLKETGCGFSQKTAKKISGLQVVDVSGKGGTHWGRIEGRRSTDQSQTQIAAETFASWGETTVDSLLSVSNSGFTGEIWGSGGVRTGLDAAKAIALGASRVGFAKPALEQAMAQLTQGRDSLTQWMSQIEFELKVALFCTGLGSVDQLRGNQGAWIRKKA